MRIGTLDKRITLQYPTRASDGMGGFTEAWVSVTPDIWAAIWPISASETIKNMQLSGEISHRIRIRYRRDVHGSWRIKFGNRYFNITGIINPNEANEMLDIMCKEAT